ncbi:MAG TPA: hypothetical protein VGM30_12665 [Puia sp.]|jgi:hypothetical protein
MKIIVVDGFKMIDDGVNEILLVESDRLDEYLEYATAKKITGISLQAYHGFKMLNTSFLKRYDFFTRISIVKDLEEIDISGIHFLKGLKTMRLSNDKQKIDFKCFPDLEVASIDWNSKLSHMDSCKKLKKLVLWKYKSKSADFSDLNELEALVSLGITDSNISTFSGIEKFHKLSEFQGHFLTKLESIKDLSSLNRTLRSLELDNCKKLKDYSPSLLALTYLEKLILTNCGELNDLNFISDMAVLNFFSFVETNVKNGDLSPLVSKKIEFIGFDDKRHYSHKMRDINPSFKWKMY